MLDDVTVALLPLPHRRCVVEERNTIGMLVAGERDTKAPDSSSSNVDFLAGFMSSACTKLLVYPIETHQQLSATGVCV